MIFDNFALIMQVFRSAALRHNASRHCKEERRSNPVNQPKTCVFSFSARVNTSADEKILLVVAYSLFSGNSFTSASSTGAR